MVGFKKNIQKNKKCNNIRFLERILLILILIVTLFSCSSGNNETENSYMKEQAQQVYRQICGSYIGKVTYNGIQQNVNIVIGDEIEVRNLPLYPLLKPFYKDQDVLKEALSSVQTQDIKYLAQTETLNINNYQILLVMKPADLIFTVSDRFGEHRIIATTQATAYKDISFSGLTLNIDVTELNFDGKDYPFTTEFINYYIDNAVKQN